MTAQAKAIPVEKCYALSRSIRLCLLPFQSLKLSLGWVISKRLGERWATGSSSKFQSPSLFFLVLKFTCAFQIFACICSDAYLLRRENCSDGFVLIMGSVQGNEYYRL